MGLFHYSKPTFMHSGKRHIDIPVLRAGHYSTKISEGRTFQPVHMKILRRVHVFPKPPNEVMAEEDWTSGPSLHAN